MNLHDLTRQDYIEYETIQQALSTTPHYDICQLKYDGIWTVVEVDPSGTARWYSRTHQLKQTRHTTLETGLYLGEFMYGQQWSKHPSRYGKTYLFDFLRSSNRDYSGFAYLDRWRELSDRLQRAEDSNLIAVGNVSISLAEPLWARVLATESEGIIFRRSCDNYHSSLGRVKREVTNDFVVLDIVEGRGKHSGRLGALVCGFLLPNGTEKVLEVGGGFSDEQRKHIWSTWPRYQFKVCTVIGKGKFESGALRHPNFVCWRDDKKPEDCK